MPTTAEASAVKALNDPEPTVRLQALEVISQLSPERAEACLIAALRHNDPIIRQRSALALAPFDRAETLAALRLTLGDSHTSVRTAAARTLEQLRWHPTTPQDEAALAVARRDLEQAAQFGAAGVEALANVLADATYPDRRAVVSALSQTGDARATKMLIQVLRDSDPSIRVAALQALGDLNDRMAAEPVRAALSDPDSHVRTAAAEVVGRMVDVGAGDRLLKCLKDAHWEVRKAAVEALVRTNGPRAVGGLIERLRDPDHDVRLAVTDALGQLQNMEAVEGLTASLIDEHAPVRRAAENALRRIDPHWESSQRAQAAKAVLKAGLKANDYWVRQAAADALTKIGAATGAAQPPPSTLSHAAHYRREAAVDILIDCLEEDDDDLCLAAVEALGRLEEPRARLALSAIASNSDATDWLRVAAQEVLPRSLAEPGSEDRSSSRSAESNKIVSLEMWRDGAKQQQG